MGAWNQIYRQGLSASIFRKKMMQKTVWLGFVFVLLSGPISCAHQSRERSLAEGELNFKVQEGQLQNYFYRRGLISTHLVVRSGNEPRIVFAFPAENSGIGLWFKKSEQPVSWQVQSPVGVEQASGLRGIQVEMSVNAQVLDLENSVLGSIRHLRDYMHLKTKPKEITTELIEVNDESLRICRLALDKKTRYCLQLRPLSGTHFEVDQPQRRFTLRSSENIQIELTALTDAKPLHPLSLDQLLKEGVVKDSDAKSAQLLAFLAYREKFLAGSWRFLTYFGRDSLISARLLMPVLKPKAMESVLAAVIERLSVKGEVAHEEDIGDFAAYRRTSGTTEKAEDPNKPIYDYKMIDDDFMLSIVLQSYFATVDGSQRKADFLSRKTSAGITFKEAIQRNFNLVLVRAAPFAKNPVVTNLVQLKDGETVGEWRDSEEGLGGGRMPFNVNAALVPAALAAVASLAEDVDQRVLEKAERYHRVWQAHALKHFSVRISKSEAQRRLKKNGQLLGLQEVVRGHQLTQDLEFPALSLSGKGQPIEVMHSDDSFMLLFNQPRESYLRQAAERIIQPFPLGLTTPVGTLVANPLFLDQPKLAKTFSADHYHGMVVWSWQQAMLAEGLKQQIGRTDISAETKELLVAAADKLWKIIADSKELSTSELWSWKYEKGQFDFVPFGGSSGHKTESNAAQLWSTVYLGVRPNF